MKKALAVIVVVVPAVALSTSLALFTLRSAVAPAAVSAPVNAFPAPEISVESVGGYMSDVARHAVDVEIAAANEPLFPEPDAAAAAEAAQTAEAEAKPPRTTLVAVGDIMLSRDVGSILRARKNVLYPYEATRAITSGADIAFANLETAVTPGKPVPTESMSFRADPETLEGLADAGFDIVSLANNHTPNYGEKGLLDTFKYLTDYKIAYVGAGANAASAYAPVPVERNGLRFVFLAYNDSDVVPGTYFAGETRAGTARMSAERVAADIAAVRERADVVVVSMHSGSEYKFTPNKRQTEFARAAVDAGADLVLGHHAHVVQPIERYNGKLIFYGLGNFVFDQMWSMATRQGLMARITFEGTEVADVELFPVLIENYVRPRMGDERTDAAVVGRVLFPVQVREGVLHLQLPALAPKPAPAAPAAAPVAPATP